MNAKPAVHSKTVLFNLAVAVAAAVSENSGLLQPLLSDGGYLLVMLSVSVINLYLRSITTTAITF